MRATARMLGVLSQQKGIAFSIIALLILAIAALFLPPTVTDLITKIAIMALFATSLNLMVGYGGMLPLGQAMFLGIGAYSYGLLVLKAGFTVELAIVAALLISLSLNAIIGFLCLRGTPMTFGLLHFAFNIQIFLIINKFVYVTGGNSGIGGVPRPAWFSNSLSYFYFVLAIVAICFILMRIIVESPFGKVVQGLRENDERLLFLGVDTRRFQLVVCVIAGLFAGLAGILLAMLNGGIYPVYVSPIQSAQAMMMCVIGGMYTFWGPALGALIVVTIGTEVSNYVSQWQGILGIIIIACTIGFRGGILRRKKGKIALPVPRVNRFSSQGELNDSKDEQSNQGLRFSEGSQ